jgi:hypothetical protein
MKLDRNTNGDGTGKYALVKLRALKDHHRYSEAELRELGDALRVLDQAGVLDYGRTPETEFFVIRLRDKCARQALYAYALEADDFDHVYAGEVRDLALRAGPNNPYCKRPD